MAVKTDKYYVPAQSPWPLTGALGLFLLAAGAGLWSAGLWGIAGPVVFAAGTLVMTIMLFGWFSNVISESHQGLYSEQMDRSFRQGMTWFIFSEIMFFGAFFGALFYARVLSVPWLGGAGNNAMTHQVLWPDFQPVWPLLTTPGGMETTAMGWLGLPLINTMILLTSSVTVHAAHLALLQQPEQAEHSLGGATLLVLRRIHGTTIPAKAESSCPLQTAVGFAAHRICRSPPGPDTARINRCAPSSRAASSEESAMTCGVRS